MTLQAVGRVALKKLRGQEVTEDDLPGIVGLKET